MKVLLWGVGIIVALLACFYVLSTYPHQTNQTPLRVTDYKNATYVIDGQPITLVDGEYATSSAPGSASQTITKYFGNEVTGDLNGDGMPDIAFLLTQNTGGSGTFYYVVVALATSTGYEGTNAIFLGDRIAPQTTEIHNGELVVNYADRKPGDPMTAAPSVGVSKFLTVEGTTLTIASSTTGSE